MNYLLILKLMGIVFKTEALLMIVPLVISFIYQSGDGIYFIYTAIPLFIFGYCLTKIKPKSTVFRSK